MPRWLRLASTRNAAATSPVAQALRGAATPREQARLTAWANKVKDSQMARLGVGGPGLSNTTFAHGVATLRQTMEDNLTATLDFKRTQSNKTFTDVHGDALALKMHRLCDVIDDADLPEVHTLLLKAG